MKNLSDSELAFRVAAYQDNDAFLQLHTRYFTKVQKFLYFRIPAKEDAEDLANQVFLKMWEFFIRSTAHNAHHPRALIYKIARNEIANFYRAQEKIPDTVALDQPGEYGDYPDIPDTEENPLEKLLKEYNEEEAIECVQKLKEPYREVIALRFFEELDINEIVEVIGKSEGNVRVLIHRGKQMLKKIIQQAQTQDFEAKI